MKQDQIIQKNEFSVFFNPEQSDSSDIAIHQQNIQNGTRHSFGTDKKTEHVPLAPQVIGQIGPLPITNSLVFSILVTLFLSASAIILSRKISRIPGKFQALIEIIIEYIYTLGEELAHERIKTFFPWVTTFFV